MMKDKKIIGVYIMALGLSILFVGSYLYGKDYELGSILFDIGWVIAACGFLVNIVFVINEFRNYKKGDR